MEYSEHLINLGLQGFIASRPAEEQEQAKTPIVEAAFRSGANNVRAYGETAFKTWLLEEVEPQTQYLNRQKMPRHRYLSFLVTANCGFQVRGWGVTSRYPNGHLRGLEQNDALSLMAFGSYMDGLTQAGVPAFDLFHPYFLQYEEEINKPKEQ